MPTDNRQSHFAIFVIAPKLGYTDTMELIRSVILMLGWPVLIAGSAFVYYRSYRFYTDVGRNVWGKLVLTMITGWLLTMYSLGIVSTFFMFVSVRNGTMVVLPVFGTWFFTMILIIRTVFRWNREAVRVNAFNQQLQTLVEERTRDLSHEKQMAEAERNKLHVVIASISDGILATDLQRRITVVNPAIEHITGYAPGELISNTVLDVLTFTENGKRLDADDVCPIRTDGFEGTLLHKDSLKLKGKHTEKDITLTVSQIKEGSVANVGCILTVHDRSKDQELEEMKLDFVSMAAHELRTPLTAIQGYVALLQEECLDAIPSEGKEYINRLAISSTTLSGLIDNLLQVSRIERNTFKIELEPTDIAPVIAGTVAAVTQEATSKQQRITIVSPDQPLPLVMADGFRINQVMTNLLANAIHYTQDNGTITVSTAVTPGTVTVTVADTGQGIPAEAIPKLFTKFFRISGALEEGSKGTGLGLYIVKSIVSMHGGSVSVESAMGKGTAFRFTLPVATEEQIAARKHRPDNASTKGKLHHNIIVNQAGLA